MSQLRTVTTPDRIEVYREGNTDRPILVQHAAAGRRAFIHPLVAPDGRGELTEDAPPHHPWQHGLYVGLNDVNGVGFWTEGLLPKTAARDGTFHPRAALAERPDRAGPAAAWRVETEWRGPDGSPILVETQNWALLDRGDSYRLDLSWQLASLGLPVRFGQYAYGGLFLRMPFRAAAGGHALNSSGRADAAAEQQPARWVAVSMSVPGRAGDDPAGVAILDHPANPGHPVRWRVDHELGICPSRCIAGPWTLAPREATTSRYRLLVHTGPTDAGAVEAEWLAFSRENR